MPIQKCTTPVYPNEAQDNEKNGFQVVEGALGKEKPYGTLEPFV